MKKIFTLLLTLTIIFSIATFELPAKAAGHGSNGKFLAPIAAPDEGSIPISSQVGLLMMSSNQKYHLTNDIDVSSTSWTAISSFTGTFDGQGYVIRGLNSSAASGMFYSINGATVKNVGLENVSFSLTSSSSGYIRVGGICGLATANSTITNCYSEGTLSASSTGDTAYAGGICGSISGGSISYCYSTANVSSSSRRAASNSDSYSGGIFGSGSSVTVTNCYNSGTIYSVSNTGSSYTRAGGIGGYISSSTIDNCYNTGVISPSANVSSSGTTTMDLYSGGICGQNATSTISNCYNSGIISSPADASFTIRDRAMTSYLGGICGRSDSTGNILNCYNTANVTAFSQDVAKAISGVGGICGYGGTISSCYNSGNISASTYATSSTATGYARSYVGGICGDFGNSISNCYNIGNISSYASSYTPGGGNSAASSYAGGIAGSSNSITLCYNAGDVAASHFATYNIYSCYAGGILGNGSNVLVGYWNSDSEQKINNVSQNPKKGVGNGSGSTFPLTNAQMKTKSSFEGFEFSTVWHFVKGSNNDYPILRALPTPPITPPDGIVSIVPSGNTVTVNLNFALKSGEVVVVAIYDATDKLLAMATNDTSVGMSIPVTFMDMPDSAHKIRAFVWDGMNTMQPLCDAKDAE